MGAGVERFRGALREEKRLLLGTSNTFLKMGLDGG